MGFSMLMIAAPSNMMTSATGASPHDVHNFSRHATRSDFVQNQSFLRAGTVTEGMRDFHV